VAHLQFAQANAIAKFYKRATKPMHQDTRNDNEQSRHKRRAAANSGLPQWELTCYYESFVVKEVQFSE